MEGQVFCTRQTVNSDLVAVDCYSGDGSGGGNGQEKRQINAQFNRCGTLPIVCLNVYVCVSVVTWH